MTARAARRAVLALLLQVARDAVAGRSQDKAASCEADVSLSEGDCPSMANHPLQPQPEHYLLQKTSNLRSQLQQVRAHTLSNVSRRWAGKVVYGVLTTSLAKYHEKLKAQLETWAAHPASEGRFVAVGGNNLPEAWQVDDVVLRSNCGDASEQISCKEGAVVEETAARGPAWAVILGEDNYVDTRRVEAFLASKNPDEPVAYGALGCGAGLFCKDVPEFSTAGGFCGGAGYFLSRAALQALAGTRQFYHDHMSWYGDMTTSCLLYKHGVRMENVDHDMHANNESEEELKGTVRAGFWTLHYLRPAEMRWVHAIASNSSEAEAARLESIAFPSSGRRSD